MEAIEDVAPKMETVEEVIVTTEAPAVIEETTEAVLQEVRMPERS